ncbi:hypothetical protein FQA39_LY05379 [Lamprigera yunnana]|nr:hypothetical protein FQA39_LY05379 [Lamprigera yunnana]
MWMLYTEQHWTKTIDLKSAVERLYEKICALEFDADHEAIYGMERYYTVQQCQIAKINKRLEERYGRLVLTAVYKVSGFQHVLQRLTTYSLKKVRPIAYNVLIPKLSVFDYS